MVIILQGLEHVAAIQDDILITGKDDEQHIQNLNTVLSRLDSYSLRLHLNKCKFMQRSVTYMGWVISAEVTCFTLRQNITFDRLLTLHDKHFRATQPYSRYLFVTNAVTA